jgi:hypothetical protein
MKIQAEISSNVGNNSEQIVSACLDELFHTGENIYEH